VIRGKHTTGGADPAGSVRRWPLRTCSVGPAVSQRTHQLASRSLRRKAADSEPVLAKRRSSKRQHSHRLKLAGESIRKQEGMLTGGPKAEK
jgi:hypothetical protein